MPAQCEIIFLSTLNLETIMNDKKLAFITAAWHADIIDVCKTAFFERMSEAGFAVDRIDSFDVPGSLEIPLTAQWLAETDKYAVILAAGFVVDGGIYRHDFVADAVIRGMMDVQLKTGIPILSAVLTPHSYHEHEDHHSFFKNHMTKKGTELANACLMTLDNQQKIQSGS